jgi:hypothetical protein
VEKKKVKEALALIDRNSITSLCGGGKKGEDNERHKRITCFLSIKDSLPFFPLFLHSLM